MGERRMDGEGDGVRAREGGRVGEGGSVRNYQLAGGQRGRGTEGQREEKRERDIGKLTVRSALTGLADRTSQGKDRSEITEAARREVGIFLLK
eukprot:3088812-Rhodomonas_salina.3